MRNDSPLVAAIPAILLMAAFALMAYYVGQALPFLTSSIIMLTVRTTETVVRKNEQGEEERGTRFTGLREKVTITADEIVLHMADRAFGGKGSVVQLRSGKKLHVWETFWALNYLRAKATRRGVGFHHYDSRKHKPEYDAWRADIFDVPDTPWRALRELHPDLSLEQAMALAESGLRQGVQPTDQDIDTDRHGHPHDTGRDPQTEEIQDDEAALHALWLQQQIKTGLQHDKVRRPNGNFVQPTRLPDGSFIHLSPQDVETLEGELGSFE